MAEAIHRTHAVRRARTRHLALRPEKARKAGWTNQEGNREALTQKFNGEIAGCSATQRLRQQLPALESPLVGAKRALIFRATVGKIENRSRQSGLRATAKLGDALGLRHLAEDRQ